MRRSRVARVVAIALVTTLAALALVRGSSASWRSAVGIGGASFTSGTLALRVGSATSQSAAWRFTALDGAVLGPGSVAQAPLTVVNAGTTRGQVTLTATTVTGRPAPLRLSVVRVASPAACPTSGAPSGTVLYGPAALAGATTAPRPLPPGTRETWCFRVAVVSSDVADSGTASTATFTLRLDQVR